jgi:hypothetical protein
MTFGAQALKSILRDVTIHDVRCVKYMHVNRKGKIKWNRKSFKCLVYRVKMLESVYEYTEIFCGSKACHTLIIFLGIVKKASIEHLIATIKSLMREHTK